MDSSLKNPNPNPSYYHHQLQPPFPPPPHIHQNYHGQGFPPVNHPPPYYLRPPPHVSFVQSACVGFMEKRIVNPNYQLDYRNRTRNGVFSPDLDNNSRFKAGFARKDFGDVRVDERYRDSLRKGTLSGYGNVGSGNQRWVDDYYHSEIERYIDDGNQRCVETSKDDYYHSEIERYLDEGKVKVSGDDMNRTDDRSGQPADLSEKRIKSFKVKRKETRCIAGNVLLAKKKKESFPPPTSSDIENLSSFQDEILKKGMEEVNDNNSFSVGPNSTTRVDRTLVSQVERSRSQACENGVNSSVEIVSRKESMETTTPLNSTAEVDHSRGSDAGMYTCIIGISSSPKNVAGKESSNVQPVERTCVLLSSICKKNEGRSNGLVSDRELSSAGYVEDVSFAPNQHLGLSSHDPAEIPSMDQSCNVDCRGLKACSSESKIALRTGTHIDASEYHCNQEDKEKSPTFNSLPVLEIGNRGAVGNMDSSRCEKVNDSESAPIETQPCPAVCKVLLNDHLGCGSSDVVCSMDKDLLEDPLRISSRLVPDSSISPCHLSPSVSVNEQTQNSASSSVAANRSSHCDLIEKERDRAEKMDVDIQKENVKPTGKTSQCGASGTDFVTLSGDSQSKTTLSFISEKTQKRANKYMHTSQERYPHSLLDTKKDANPPMNVTKHHTWHRKSDTSASPLVAVNPKVTVRSSSTFVRIGNSLIRKPSPGSLGEAQTLQRRSRPFSDSTSSRKCTFSSGVDPLSNGLPGSSSEEADDPDYFRNGLKSSDTLAQTRNAPDCQRKQNLTKLGSLNTSKLLFGKRKANQLVATSDIHGVSTHSGGYYKRSKNQLVRNSEYLVNQEKSLSDDSLDSGEKMVTKRSYSSALSEFAVMRPFNQSSFSLDWTLKEPLSRKANRVHRSPHKIVPQPVPWKRGTYWRRLKNPALVQRNGSSSTISRKFPMLRNRRTIYRRSTNEYSLRRSKALSIGGSHLKWSKSVERDSKDTRRLVIGNDESVWIRNGNLLVGDPKKRTRVLANEKVRWSLHNVRLRTAKKRNYCQFFTRFGKCNKDDGKCPYIHDPSKVAVCTKFVSSSCANPDCKLTHKVVPERMPDCSYYLQGLCNNEPCLYRHVHVNQNASICEGFLRGYCSDGNECRKKHTYTCPVFEAKGYCPQESECKLHHPKNPSKGKKRKRANEPWLKNSHGRYFGSMHIPESEPVLINKLATTDGAVFEEEGLDFIRLDVNEYKASENMDSSTRESVSDDSEARDSIDELIRPVGLMQK